MRTLYLIISIIALTISFHSCQRFKGRYKAELDTAFDSSSGISHINNLDSVQIENLTRFAMVWGFVKYFHPSVVAGNHNMDAELFRVLPGVLNCKSGGEANLIFEKWIDHFGECDSSGKKKRAFSNAVIQETNYGVLFDSNYFPQSLIKKLHAIKNSESKTENYYLSSGELGDPVFAHEVEYNKNGLPDAGLRMLALFRYWNNVQYGYPYRHLISEDWNKVLSRLITEFAEADTKRKYHLACLKLVATIKDTHAFIEGDEIEKVRGPVVPIEVKFIEDKLVITDYDSLWTGNRIHIGDIIERINGIPVDGLVARYAPLISASNTASLRRNLASSGFLFSSHNQEATLQIRRKEEKLDVAIKHAPKIGSQLAKKSEGYEILPNNIGYIYPAKLSATDINTIRKKFEHTRGIIIDLRCYPRTFMPFTYGDWLKPQKSAFVKIYLLTPDRPGTFLDWETIENGSNNDRNCYKGKVIILVNELTQSQAEYTAMALRTIPGALVVGTTTAGADGEVSAITLPGGLKTFISGVGILYPDGTETQQRGIKIDRYVFPTIKGITERRDEQMEYAIKCISESQGNVQR